ncbi:hypothetical protein Tco_0631308 [Tanacetum coccineum]
MDDQSHYKQDKTITRQSINVKHHIFNVIGDTEKFEERDLNIRGDSDDEISPPPPPPQTPTQQAPHTVSSIKLPILKKDTNGVIKVLPRKTAKEILARERERKARTTLLMALTEDHLAKFHKMTDAKDMWDAIKSRFGGNDESKKMQKYILKQQFEGFSVSNSEGLHKGYDKFQSLLSQLEIHGAGVSTEDANQKFLRSLPSSWSQVSLVIRTKPGVDNLSIDDLYNNLRVFDTSSTNDVSTAYRVSTSSGYNSQRENSSSYTDELILKKFYKKTGRKLHFDAKEPVVFDKTKVEYNCHKTWHFARECRSKGNTGYKSKDIGRRLGKHKDPKALVTLAGEGVDWTNHVEDEQENFALMAYSNSGSDTERRILSIIWRLLQTKHRAYRIPYEESRREQRLLSDIIRLVQNGCSFYGLRSEDPNQHLKDFFKLVDSLDLDGENRERTRLRLFQFFLRNQASNWLERLLAGSISTWEDLTT